MVSFVMTQVVRRRLLDAERGFVNEDMERERARVEK